MVTRGRTVSSPSYDQLLVGLAGWVLLGCAAWAALLVVAALVEGLSHGRLPALGWVGAPVPVRRALLTAVGLVLVGVPAHGVPPPSSRTQPDLAGTSLPVPARPLGGPAPQVATRSAPPAPAATASGVPTTTPLVVRRGDTLWGLVEQRLPPGATTALVAAEVAAWHRHNRAVIGPDADLIRPGQRLRPPPTLP